MLPFLKPKKMTGIIVAKRKEDGSNKVEEQSTDALDSASEALLRAVEAKDAKAVSTALREAFKIMELEPHEEIEHEESEEKED